jgi:predicted nucleotidyltransferase
MKNLQSKIPGKIIFKAIVGSQAYGTNNENSDIDIKGVYIQDIDEVSGFKTYKPQIEISKDEVYFEIGRFLELLQKGNPTVLELLASPEDCILERFPEWYLLIEQKEKFISKDCRNAFVGYAQSQITKATGTDKKFNWEGKKMVRKEPLDFCYSVNQDICSVIPLKQFLKANNINQENCVFNKLDHSQELFSLFHYPNKLTKGLQSDNGNTIRLDSSEKGSNPIAIVSFNLNAYSIHCKKYREYEEWMKNRNTQRYVDINEHGQKIDGKNMLHCIRLLEMGKEILEGKGLIVRRPNAQYLKEIRKGKYNLEEILENGKSIIKEIESIHSDLPEAPSDHFINCLLLSIRNYEQSQPRF